MNWTSDKYRMICASAEAEERTYKMFTDKLGHTWLVAIQPNEGDNIYVSGGPNSQGFAGRTLTFKLENGDKIELKSPWHTNSDALFSATGYDTRDKHSTFVVVGLGRKTELGYATTITDVLYKDDEWTVGTFDRGEKIAQKYADELDKMVMLYQGSTGGSSCSPVYPTKNRTSYSERKEMISELRRRINSGEFDNTAEYPKKDDPKRREKIDEYLRVGQDALDRLG